MNALQIDPKYSILISHDPGTGHQRVEIVNLSGVPIPDDEPLMLFRARDWNALPMLEYYRQIAVQDGCTDFHLNGISNRIEAFAAFKAEHPERMKQPGVTKGTLTPVTPIPESKAERIWRAVLEHLSYEKIVNFVHEGCADSPPDECTLYEVIADAMGGNE